MVAYAVRLLTNVIWDNFRRSALAPALSRSMKWSRTAARTLFKTRVSIPINIARIRATNPHPIISQNLIMPAAKDCDVCAKF